MGSFAVYISSLTKCLFDAFSSGLFLSLTCKNSGYHVLHKAPQSVVSIFTFLNSCF